VGGPAAVAAATPTSTSPAPGAPRATAPQPPQLAPPPLPAAAQPHPHPAPSDTPTPADDGPLVPDPLLSLQMVVARQGPATQSRQVRREEARKRRRARRGAHVPSDAGAATLLEAIGQQRPTDVADTSSLLEDDYVRLSVIGAAVPVYLHRRHGAEEARRWRRLVAQLAAVGVTDAEVRHLATTPVSVLGPAGTTAAAQLADSPQFQRSPPPPRALRRVAVKRSLPNRVAGMVPSAVSAATANSRDRDLMLRGALHGVCSLTHDGTPHSYVGRPRATASSERQRFETHVQDEEEAGRYFDVSAVFRAAPDLAVFAARTGFVAKKNSTKLRLVQDFSFPPADCVNQHSTAAPWGKMRLGSLSHIAHHVARFERSHPGQRLVAGVVDYSHAYRSVAVSPRSIWQHAVYDFTSQRLLFDTSLPFGSSTAPAAMSRYGVLTVRSHRAVDGTSDIYIDDTLVLDVESAADASYDAFVAQSTAMGFEVNASKGERPAPVAEWIGFRLDFDAGTVAASKAKLKEARNGLYRLLARKRIRVAELRSLTGLLAHLARVVEHGRPFLRPFYVATAAAHAAAPAPRRPPAPSPSTLPQPHTRAGGHGGQRSRPRGFVRASPSLLSAAGRWMAMLRLYSGVTLIERAFEPDVELFTDASTSYGYGFWCPQLNVYGTHKWSVEEHDSLNHINVMEMFGIDGALAAVASRASGMRLRVVTDSHVCRDAVFAGRSRRPAASTILARITSICMDANISLSIRHISSKQNHVADDLSRVAPLPRECATAAQLHAPTVQERRQTPPSPSRSWTPGPPSC